MLRDLQRVAPSHVWRRTHVPESNRRRSLINSSTRLNHLAVGQGVDRQPELLGPEAFRRPEERTDKFAFDDFAAALDAEQVFHSAAQNPRELKCNRSGGRILMRLHGRNRLSGYARHVGKLFL